MPRRLRVLQALLPFVLHGLARLLDAGLGLALHSSLAIDPGAAAVRLVASAPTRLLATLVLSALIGSAAWLVLGALRARLEPIDYRTALAREASAFIPLYLRPALTVLALLSCAVHPSYPYGFTLPVALTQDWGIGQDALALAWFVASRVPPIRVPVPRAGAVFFVSFLVYALLTPEWARRWEGHPGNEPKYLRQAVALAHGLTLDAEGVSAPMEQLVPEPWGAALFRAAGTLGRETVAMLSAVARGPSAIGAEAIRATRITRQTIGGKDGGIYYVLAPGPSLLLAPTVRMDRALNRLRGIEGRLAVSVLVWNALGAALVAAVFLLARDATGRAGLAAVVAAFFAMTPPFLFYFFQFYPEMVGALLLALAFRWLAFSRGWTAFMALLLGVTLAALPWLHQKFLPVWGVLTLTALGVFWRRKAPRPAWIAALAPQALGAFLTALYNFAITGSARPDALFLAWGPAGVTTARIGQGLLGLLFDARYGIVPYAPVYLLAGAGLVIGLRSRSPLLLAVPAAVVYYVTVAAADNWAGAVCNLGRYFMPVAPLAAAFVALALAPLAGAGRRGELALALALCAWTAIVAGALWGDPHAANDSAVLLAKSTVGDGHVYVPGLFIRRWSDAAPGLRARVLAWIAAALVLAFAWVRRRARPDESPHRAVAGLLAFVLVVAFLLERWPSRRTRPAFPGEISVDSETTAFVSGPVIDDAGTFVARRGEVDVLVRSSEARTSVPVLVGGDGLYRVGGLTFRARPSGAFVSVPLVTVATLRDGEGRSESFARGGLTVDGEVVLRFDQKMGNSTPTGFVHD